MRAARCAPIVVGGAKEADMREKNARRQRARVPDRKAAPAHEWETDRWKHQVEAEARGRFKRSVRGVGRLLRRDRD
jgi:hypothetical protein